MVLKRKAPADFEQMEQDAAADEAQADQTRAVDPSQPSTAPQPGEVVTAPRTALVANSRPKVDINHVRNLKNFFKVQYNTLPVLQAVQGQFMERGTTNSLGSELLLELLSFQDSFVITPNDDKGGKDLVRYSDDGITCTDGVDVKQHLHDLKEMGWKDARVNSRYVIVGAVLASEKGEAFNGKLVQFDLPPTSRGKFDEYLIQVTYDLAKGVCTPEQAVILDLTAVVGKYNKDGQDKMYPMVKFATHVG